jgi:hypothetical protein
MSELLNEVTKNESITTYDRSYAGGYDNPYNGRPSLLFHMHRVTVRNSDDTIIATQSLPNIREPFTPGKIYQLYNPSTGSAIPGQEFSAESAYAIIYSMMTRALADNQAVAEARATLVITQNALAASEVALENALAAQAALPPDADNPTQVAAQTVVDQAIIARDAAQTAYTTAQTTLAAALAAIA